MNSDDRALLASIRVCNVSEPWLGDVIKYVPHIGQRVLVPRRLINMFEVISKHGGEILKVQIKSAVVKLARVKLGAHYYAKASCARAPKFYSCSTFVYWVMAFVGIHMPRYAIDQSYIGRVITKPNGTGLAFYQNTHPLFDTDRTIGHVGLTTKEGTIIHGSNLYGKIVEEPIPEGAVMFTNPFPRHPSRLIIIPKQIQGVETALDLARWLARPLT